MKERATNILRASIIMMLLTIWLPTSAVLIVPHENRWVERNLETAQVTRRCPDGSLATYNECWWDSYYESRFDWDGWAIFGPITLALLAGLYFISGSLSLRLARVKNMTEEE